MPFDQHMLAALIAPRLLAVCSAEKDTWADPQSEFMSLFEAGKAYELLGLPGLIAPAEYPPVSASFAEGRLGYSLRVDITSPLDTQLQGRSGSFYEMAKKGVNP